MIKLSDLQLAGVIDEIACAMKSGAPVERAMRRLQTRRMGRVGRCAGQIADQLDRGQSLEQAISVIRSPMTSQISAAIAAVGRGADQRLISRLGQQLRRRSQFMGTAVIAYFYPIVLLMVAYVATVMVAVPLVNRNQGRDFRWEPWLVSACQWLEQNAWWPPLIALLIGVLIWWLLTGRSSLSRHARLSLFFYSLADQIEADVPEQEAIVHAAKLSGDSMLSGLENPTLASPPIAKLIGRASELTDIDEEQRTNAAVTVSGSNSGSSLGMPPSILAARLYFLGSWHAEASRRSGYFWSRFLPRTLMVVVGCGFVISYAWWVIAPVYRQVAQW
ncbi:Bacterial type II secretion system protein F domain protein [Rubripirellula tenax]|uniref:Bacterial type II secretion system protein F domain protein n=1 Tax=Rubripirellula tenax TaxID=2528015 RepID=A0A5C6EJ18_9BACT|nr:type II secretion system F family protein [Rubripirellula tenax]TWU47249.1 Bacterial type II secretion system protein F domain protein [Rubripirellula tenax]